jgi:gamma-glutamyltranspeptidase
VEPDFDHLITDGKFNELPPNGQGMAALEMLNINVHPALRTKPGRLRPRSAQTALKAMKLAYSDLIRYKRRPSFCQVCQSRDLLGPD